jgi:hypothetical protein
VKNCYVEFERAAQPQRLDAKFDDIGGFGADARIYSQRNRKAEQDPRGAREPLCHRLPMRRGQFAPGLKGSVLENRPLVANLSADLDFLAY